MPRYNDLKITDVRILENVNSVFSDYSSYRFENDKSDALPNDLKLTWGGSLEFDEYEQDIKLAYSVEAFVQELYAWLVTNIGEFPSNEFFGWDYKDLIGSTQKIKANDILLRIKGIENLPSVELLDDIIVEESYDNDLGRHFLIKIFVKPRGYKYKLLISSLLNL